MLRASAVVRCDGVGAALYSRQSTLPSDFFACLHDYFGATLHVPCYLGARSSQLRGLFYGYAPHHTTTSARSTLAPLAANQPVLTVPLSSLYTVANVAHKPLALPPHVTVDAVRRAVVAAATSNNDSNNDNNNSDDDDGDRDEMALLAPQLYLGLQFAAMVDAVPSASSADDAAALARVAAQQRQAAAPWLRMLDDEDFNTDFVYGMYGSALDTWQRDSYFDLTRKFDAATAAVHAALQPLPFKVDLYRRITRLLLARVEHVPTLASFDTARGRGGVVALQRCARRVVHAARAALARQRCLPARLRAALTPCAQSELAMVPGLDLVNHSNRPNCGVRFARSPVLHGAPAVTLYTLTRVLPGQELCRHYNFALSRPVALFRYGFLPFDVVSIVNIDAASEYMFKRRDDLEPEADEVLRKARLEEEQVARLEQLYQTARQSSSSSSSQQQQSQR